MKLGAAIGLSVGLATSVHAQTRVEYQVSRALQEQWQSSLLVTAGESIDVRVRLSYLGTQSPLGLGSLIFQPTVSNWSSATGDVLSPFLNTGGNTTVPSGVVTDAPGQYGRLSPWGRSAVPTSTPLIGHLNSNAGTDYLRIAPSNFTSWIGQGNNTTGVGGIICAQLTDIGRTAQDPVFESNLQNIVVFKFNIVVGSTELRNMVFDTPLNGFGNRDSATDLRYGHWVGSMSEPTGSIREQAFAVPASIFVVPAPSSLALLGLAALSMRRRR
jgi:hypothetical protein